MSARDGELAHVIVVVIGALFGLAVVLWNSLTLFLRAPRFTAAAEVATGVFAGMFWVPGVAVVLQDAEPWSAALVNYQDTGVQGFHHPFAPEHSAVLILLAVVGVAGYLTLRIDDQPRRPPLLTVLALAGVYLGCAVSIVTLLQVFGQRNDGLDAAIFAVYFATFPLCFLLRTASLLRRLAAVFAVKGASRLGPGEDGVSADTSTGSAPVVSATADAAPRPQRVTRRTATVAWCERMLARSSSLPWYGLALALPLLGVITGVLALFGQAPDGVVRAMTDTADWAFSQRTPPPMIQKADSHYLCTVAAQGSPAVVKPLRMGRRHGGPIVVNRQLCVANAFEDLLAERLPGTHRRVRSAYDRWGYPLSRHITTTRAADFTYRLMKPLEWGFLAVLYLCDSEPERRIARQYQDSTPTAHRRDQQERRPMAA